MARALASAAAVALAIAGWQSLGWQMMVDAPLLAYAALAVDRFGTVPYRDLFDFNTPGAYLVNIAIGRTFGYTETGFRIADLACLSIILGASAISLRRFGWAPAAAAPLLFGFTYLGYGAIMSLQREYFLLAPLALSL